ncbi:MAG: glutamate 5-kinase [Candidatus Omnitrophota bacterium]
MRDCFFPNIKRVVIKVGTSVLTSASNTIDQQEVKKIVDTIRWLRARNIRVILVSSGAIAFGMRVLGLKHRPKRLAELQACAALGQHRLMNMYDEVFSPYGCHIAQILLTADELHFRQRYLNARNTIFSLWNDNVLPIINENDTTATEEIKFGDNDKLSALVANLIEADLLIILSDVDGIYNSENEVIGVIEEITPEITRLAKGTNKATSLGGMRSKLEAAKIVTNSGISLLVANGRTPGLINKIFNGEAIGTLFIPRAAKMKARKRWIAFSCRIKGKIFIDQGAGIALIDKGKSLLCSGVINCVGNFAAGDIVGIYTNDKHEIARGITNYSNEELVKIQGRKTAEVLGILGYKNHDEIIHRNNLVILEKNEG